MKLLEVVKSAEKPTAIYLMIHDEIGKKVAAAWTLYDPDYRDVEADPKASVQDCYRKAWAGHSIASLGKLASIAGVDVAIVNETFTRLMQRQLVYPDGTVHKILLSILQAEVNTYIREIIPRPSATPKT